MSLLEIARPRGTREALLGSSLVVLVPLALLGGLIGGHHLPPIASAAATSTSPSPQASGMAAVPSGSSAGALTSDQMDAMMSASIKAFPAKTAGLGGQLLQPAVQADGSKQYELTAAITPWEVSPGHIVQAWTYNGAVPGPTIHVNVGDKVRVLLHNNLPESTVIHFHGLIVPNAMDGVPDITQPPVKPGQSFKYEFTAQGPAVGMYHSHDDSAKQVTSGLAGAFLVGQEPLPNGVQPKQEFPMVLNDAGPIGLSLNGKSFPATAPIVAHFGDWILVHYYNEGFQIHPMHVHGIAGLVVAKDGFALASPYMADTVLVAPGERYSLLIHADQPGTWAWHCHILTHAENATGMFGMVTALIVK
jgi:manganese oxidase